jgi:D-methionine transport system permease protein
VALIGFTAMGGAIGSGGLGDLFRDGYQRSHTDVALVTVVPLLVLCSCCRCSATAWSRITAAG